VLITVAEAITLLICVQQVCIEQWLFPMHIFVKNFGIVSHYDGDRGSTVAKVLCYKSEGRWFDPSWCQWIFHWHKNPSDRTMALGSSQPLTEMNTRSISWGKGGRCVRQTTYHHPVSLSRNLGTLTSWNPLGLSRPVMGMFYLFTSLRYNHFFSNNFLYTITGHPAVR